MQDVTENSHAVPVTVLTFQPGETVKPALVNIIDDTTNETTEFFTVTLNNATNASIRER